MPVDDSASELQKRKQYLYQRSEQLFLEALQVDADQRERWLSQQTGLDPQIQRQVLAMLRADQVAQDEERAAPIETVDHPSSRESQSPVSDPSDSLPGLANYEVIAVIARGGMGVVYKARQLRPNRLVAIKMIRGGRFASELEVERFFTEAEAAAQLDDEAVVPVYEMGTAAGEPFIAMKFVDGESLEPLLQRAEISTTEVIDVLIQVCRAVAGAHRRGIIHRDLKPSNILIDRTTGRPWITDFGLAKYLYRESGATTDGDILGTPGYMAPEQAMGQVDVVSFATDIYGLGAILYRVLTGHPPIHSDEGNLVELIQLIREHEIVPPRSLDRRIPAELNTVCMKCLETDPERRYADATELADDLQRFLDDEPIQARPLGWTRKVTRWARHRPGLAISWCAIALFYLYHRTSVWCAWYDDVKFDIVASCLAATAVCVAWFWQFCLMRTKGASWVLFAWLTSDIGLLTVFLFAADSANSSLVLLYHVIVAASVLRCRPTLVVYATCLAMAGYATHLAFLQITDPASVPDWTKAVPTLLSIMIIGMIQCFSLRRSAISYESQAAQGNKGRSLYRAKSRCTNGEVGRDQNRDA